MAFRLTLAELDLHSVFSDRKATVEQRMKQGEREGRRQGWKSGRREIDISGRKHW